MRVMTIGCLLALATVALAAPPRRLPDDLPWSAGTLEGLAVLPSGALSIAPGRTQGTFTSPVFALGRPCDRIVPSWNSHTGDGNRLAIQARPFRGETALCDWLTVARWSRNARGPRDAGSGDVTVDQDTVKVRGGADRVQLRVLFESAAELRAIGVAAFSSSDHPAPGAAPAAAHDLPVPYRSQRTAPAAIASRVCGPTSLSMLLAYLGRDLTIEAVAGSAMDPPGPIAYGNWAFLAAAASELGFVTDVRAFASFDDVVRELAAGHPVILPIRFRRGELAHAPIASTDGHLILARGVTAAGGILVNDPAGHGPRDGQVAYDRRQLAHAWEHGIAILVKR